jgi:hypothetical protein
MAQFAHLGEFFDLFCRVGVIANMGKVLGVQGFLPGPLDAGGARGISHRQAQAPQTHQLEAANDRERKGG